MWKVKIGVGVDVIVTKKRERGAAEERLHAVTGLSYPEHPLLFYPNTGWRPLEASLVTATV